MEETNTSLCVIEIYGVRVSIEDFCGLRFLLDFLELYNKKLCKASESLARYGTLNVVVKQQEQLVLVAVIIKDAEGKVWHCRRTQEIAMPALPKTTARNIWWVISHLLNVVRLDVTWFKDRETISFKTSLFGDDKASSKKKKRQKNHMLVGMFALGCIRSWYYTGRLWAACKCWIKRLRSPRFIRPVWIQVGETVMKQMN